MHHKFHTGQKAWRAYPCLKNDSKGSTVRATDGASEGDGNATPIALLRIAVSMQGHIARARKYTCSGQLKASKEDDEGFGAVFHTVMKSCSGA